MADRSYIFRLRGDAGQLETAADSAAKSVDRLAGTTEDFARQQAAAAANSDRFTSRVGALEKGTTALGKGAKLTSYEVNQLHFQLHDFFVQVASGQSPLTAAIQQGSQLSGTFGGMGGTLRALGSVLTPTVVGLGSLALGITAVGYAAVKGHEESVKLNDAIAVTGNFAGTSVGRVDQLALSIAKLESRPIGDVREALQSLVASAAFGPQSLDVATRAVVNFQRFSDKSADEIVKDFAGMANGVAKWAAEHNKHYNFITSDQFKYIRSLEAAGRTQDAMAFTLEAINTKFESQTRNLGYLEKAYKGTKDAILGVVDALKSLGREDTAEGRLARLQADLDARKARGPLNSLTGAAFAKGNARLEGDIDVTSSDVRLNRRAAARQAETAAKAQKDIEHQSDAHQQAMLSKEKAGFALRQAQEEAAREALRIALQRSYESQDETEEGQLITARELQEKFLEIDRQGLEAKIATIERERKLEEGRKPGSEDERIAREARLLDISARRIGVEKELEKLRTDEASGKRDIVPRVGVQTLNEQFRQFEHAQAAATEQAVRQSSEAAIAAANELVQVNRGLSIELILDDRKRGEAQIALEEEQLRKRLLLDQLSASDRKAVEEDLATWRVRREALLTEQLKPEWQRNLDTWKDQTRSMRQIYDDFQNGLQSSSLNAWTNFLKTGKLSLKSLADIAIEAIAKVTFQNGIGQLVAKGGEALGSLLGIKPQDVGQAGAAASAAAVSTAMTAAAETTAAASLAVTEFSTVGVAPASLALTALTEAAAAASASLSAVAASGGGAGGAGGLGGLLGLFGGGGGGAASAGAGSGLEGFGPEVLSLVGLAGGGEARARSLHRVNENGPELLSYGGNDYLMMGAQGGFVSPLSARDGSRRDAAQAARTIVNMPPIVIEDHVGVRVEQRQATGPNGEQQMRLIVTQAVEAVKQDIAAGGGTHAVLEATYGLQRQGPRRA